MSILFFSIFFASGCADELTIKNSAPRVTFVSVEPLGDDVSLVTLWVSDVEGESVDVAAGWIDASGAETPLTLAEGSYGLIGLPTREALLDPVGQPHAILWDTSDVPAQIQLAFTPDDRPFESKNGQGATGTSAIFGKIDGLPTPVELQ